MTRHFPEQSSTPVWLRRFTKLVAASTLFLIFAGAMVTSTGSGLAVPDWPLSYGMLMPPMVAGIFYEHGHRMIASTVGFLTIIQAVWLQLREPKRFVRILGWWALAAVVVQGLLGGLTVIFLLPLAVSVSHAALAEIFFCINISIAFFTSRWFETLKGSRVPASGSRVGNLALLLAIAAFLQIFLGAVMRHLGAGLAIPDFPLSFGRLIPPIETMEIAANFAHRVGAVVVTVLVIALAIRVYRERVSALKPLVTALCAIVALQIYLGARVVWDASANVRIYHSLAGEEAIRHATVTSFHVMTGATTFALTVLLALAARCHSDRSEESGRAAIRELLGDEVPA
ncbi:MAG TPA: COX15/CtaA family protein [Thermoanaerobaculia bacterium]|nr:COX15/CtaA family protein [Thermoanaerobaculia bacterium]